MHTHTHTHTHTLDLSFIMLQCYLLSHSAVILSAARIPQLFPPSSLSSSLVHHALSLHSHSLPPLSGTSSPLHLSLLFSLIPYSSSTPPSLVTSHISSSVFYSPVSNFPPFSPFFCLMCAHVLSSLLTHLFFCSTHLPSPLIVCLFLLSSPPSYVSRLTFPLLYLLLSSFPSLTSPLFHSSLFHSPFLSSSQCILPFLFPSPLLSFRLLSSVK